MGNPNWQRDPDRLLRIFQSESQLETGTARDLIDAAVAATRRYRGLHQQLGETDTEFSERRDCAWDDILIPLDEFLKLRQTVHLQAVREAGASGPQVPRA